MYGRSIVLVRRHHDGDGMPGRSAQLYDEWCGGKLEIHALADAFTTGGAARCDGLQLMTVLNEIDPSALRQRDPIRAWFWQSGNAHETGVRVGRLKRLHYSDTGLCFRYRN